jgi:hypothetical protein
MSPTRYKSRRYWLPVAALSVAVIVLLGNAWRLATTDAGALPERRFVIPSHANDLAYLLIQDDGSMQAILADGYVDDEEYAAAAARFEECVVSNLPTATLRRHVGFAGKLTFDISTGSTDLDGAASSIQSCAARHWNAVDLVRAQQSLASEEYLQEVREAMAVCILTHGFHVDATRETFAHLLQPGVSDPSMTRALVSCQKSVAEEQYGLRGFFGY